MTYRCEDDEAWPDMTFVGAAQQMTEFPDWTDEELAAHKARRARKKPIGFAPWPSEDT